MAKPAAQERAFTVRWLRMLRDQYSDDVPAVMIHSTDRDAAYKVRGGWWLLLNLVLEHAVSEHLFGSKFGGKVRGFADRVTRDDFAARPRTAGDIDMGNRIIDEALQELEDQTPA